MTFTEFLDAALSESGSISFGRLASLILLLFVLIWDSAYMIFSVARFGVYHFSLGDILPPVSTLLGQIAFCLSPYGITKGTSLASGAPKSPENGQDK